MSSAPTLWQRLGRAAHQALFPRYWIAVLAQEPLKLVLSSDGREVTVDGRMRQVFTAEKVLALFDAVRSIDTVHHPRDDVAGKPEHWSVSLYLGRSQRAFVGRSRKKAQAQKAAALVAKMTGKEQRELEVLGPDSHIHSR